MKPSEQTLASRRRQRHVMAGLGILALVLLSIASFRSYSELRLGKSRAAQLRSEIAEGDSRIEALEERIERLKEDPAMLERLAREELLMARPGEIVILLPDETRAAAPEPGVAADGDSSGAGDG